MHFHNRPGRTRFDAHAPAERRVHRHVNRSRYYLCDFHGILYSNVGSPTPPNPAKPALKVKAPEGSREDPSSRYRRTIRLDIGERSVLGEALHRPVEPLCLDGAFGDGFVVDFEGDSARLREKQLNGCQSFADCHKPRIKT